MHLYPLLSAVQFAIIFIFSPTSRLNSMSFGDRASAVIIFIRGFSPVIFTKLQKWVNLCVKFEVTVSKIHESVLSLRSVISLLSAEFVGTEMYNLSNL